MSEFRQNIATGEWVIIAPERRGRPDDYVHAKLGGDLAAQESYHVDCPFCRGNEAQCREPVYEILDGRDWKIRVVPNIFAALDTDANPSRQREGVQLKAGGYGVAEVLIESPLHNVDLATLPLAQVEEVIKAYRYRYNEISADPAINIVNIFRNHGPNAGASLRHPHSQIIGCMVAPPHVTDQIEYAKRYYNTWGTCVYCTAIEDELKQGVRIVQESQYFVAYCPFASKSPYEVRIYPRRHCSIFGALEAEEEIDLAMVLKQTLMRLRILLDDPDYNFYIRSATTSDGQVQFYHWYLTIVPRTSHHAGFELGTGIYINTSSPEVCAAELRNVKLPELPPGLSRRL
ncbi:MAG TPA: DUF4931 domain-containing protein [Fibrobacteraceae bacterium]|nr:DUF4931 domain-containing protein [Fibrobacteraceae bacterium]